MGVEFLASYTWPTDCVPVAGLHVRAADLAARLGLPLATWSVDGLGPASGFGARLPSGRVILVEELEYTIHYQYAPGPAVYVDAGDLGALGAETLVQEILAAMRLSQADLAFVADAAAQQHAAELATSILAARPR